MEAETSQAQEAPVRPARKAKIIIALGLILFLVLSSIGIYFYTLDHEVFFPKISLYDVDLSGLTLEQGRQELKNQLSTELSKEITFDIGEQDSLTLPLKVLGVSFNLDIALEQAWSVGRQGNMFNQIWERLPLHGEREITLETIWDDQALKMTLDEAFQSYTVSPQDAYFELGENNTLQIIPEQLGCAIDFDVLAEELKKVKVNPAEDLPRLEVPVSSSVYPKVTQEQLKGLQITGFLSSFTTYFDSSLINRSENIRLAAKAIDKKLLAPGETFSFNETVGERTVEAGYKEAMIIEGDVFTPGLGGGICQVSSTLYNAILQGHLQVIERHPHSLPITYVAPGRDATVSYPILDLKFRNSSQGYLLIRSRVLENSITFELYGRQ